MAHKSCAHAGGKRAAASHDEEVPALNFQKRAKLFLSDWNIIGVYSNLILSPIAKSRIMCWILYNHVSNVTTVAVSE